MNKKLQEKSQHKMYKDIYFSPKWRKWNKTMFLKLEKSALKYWERLDELTPKDREFAGELAHLSALGLERIKDAEKFDLETKLTHRTFRLYKHPQKPTVVFIFSFYKTSEKIYKKNSWYVAAGMPTRKHPLRIARMSRLEIPTEGFFLKDSGTFRERYTDFNRTICTLTGKKIYKIFAKAKSKGSEGDVYISFNPIK